MERVLLYSAAGCFVGTILSIILYNVYLASFPFVLFLLPMWGFIMGTAIAKAELAKKPKKRK